MPLWGYFVLGVHAVVLAADALSALRKLPRAVKRRAVTGIEELPCTHVVGKAKK